MNISKRQQAYVEAIQTHASDIGIDLTTETFTRAELRLVSMKLKGKKWIPNWITHDQSRRVGRGMFSIPEAVLVVAPGQENCDDMEQDTVEVPSQIDEDMVVMAGA